MARASALAWCLLVPIADMPLRKNSVLAWLCGLPLMAVHPHVCVKHAGPFGLLELSLHFFFVVAGPRVSPLVWFVCFVDAGCKRPEILLFFCGSMTAGSSTLRLLKITLTGLGGENRGVSGHHGLLANVGRDSGRITLRRLSGTSHSYIQICL